MSKPALLYIHIPFCIRRCRDCTACVLIGDKAAKQEYLGALEAEIAASAPTLADYRFSAVYVGGGSPTTLNPDALSKFMRMVRKLLPVETRAEITMETMPQTVCTASLGGLKTGGVNRISLSMQSAIQEELEVLDCGFSLWDVQNAILFLDRFHFNNVNIDLMYGIPGQTTNTLKRTLRAVHDFAPVHVSLYPFRGTSAVTAAGTAQTLQSGDGAFAEELLAYAVERLAEDGYERYSAYHFARKGRESVYWKSRYEGMEYVGLGLGARSLVDGFTYTNTTDWETYRNHSAEFETIVTDIAELTTEQMRQYVSTSRELLLA